MLIDKRLKLCYGITDTMEKVMFDKLLNKGKETIMIKTQCNCNYGFVETGIGNPIGPDQNHLIIQVLDVDGHVLYSNHFINEDMDDLEMRCIRCGEIARY